MAPRRFLLAPLWWITAGLLGVAVYATIGWLDAAIANRPYADAARVTGSVDPQYDGRSLRVPVTYRNPFTGEDVATRLKLHQYRDAPPPGATIALDASATDPGAVRLAGRAVSATSGVADAALIAALLTIGPALLRWIGIRRARRAIERPESSFVMIGSLRSRRRGKYPLLDLYPVDARPGARPVCTIALASVDPLPIGPAWHRVEVKGSPRPFGHVVARLEAGPVLWPAGRALAVAGHTHLPAPAQPFELAAARPRGPVGLAAPWRHTPLAIAVAAAALIAGTAMFAVTAANRAAERAVAVRSVSSTARVVAQGESSVTLAFEWDGSTRTAPAPVAEPSGYTLGRRYPILVDPARPDHVRTLKDPYDAATVYGWAGLAVGASLLVVLRLAYLRQRARRALRSGELRVVAIRPVATTADRVIVCVQATPDPNHGIHGWLALPRTSAVVRPRRERTVVIAGPLNPHDRPVILADGRAWPPASRLLFGLPLTARPLR